MAVSPLVMPSGTPAKKAFTNAAKAIAKSQPNDTGKEMASSNEAGGRDLAEQMNEAEKQKYIKGTYPTPSNSQI